MVGEGTGKGPRSYSAQLSRAVFKLIKRTKAANVQQQLAEGHRRRTDPVEIALTALRRRGYTNVYPESVKKPGSTRFVVGNRVMSKSEMLRLAARVGRFK